MSDTAPKEINQKRLVRIFKDIKIHNNEESRFCFLLGAGASKSSNIPTGVELAQKWYAELEDDLDVHEFKRFVHEFKINPKTIGESYTQLYEKRFESSPQLGYEEFKKLMEDKEPSIGYVILSQILAKEKHNFVITTNFDYLVEDAVRTYTHTKPFAAGHETLAAFISSQTERPTIIKVHRDLFLHPFNDKSNTNKLKDEWKNALLPILRNFNLLVIGYGGNDGSLMDYLNEIKSEQRKAIYWCLRENEVLNDKAKRILMSKDYIVRINDFDDLMYALLEPLDITVLNDLDKPGNHEFIRTAKRRLANLNDKVIELAKRNGDISNNSVKTPNVVNLFKGVNYYLYSALNAIDLAEKEKIFIEGIEAFPKSVVLLGSYAQFLIDNTNNYLKAEKLLNKAFDIDPENPSLLNNFALFLIDFKADYETAEKLYQRCLSIEPEKINYLLNYASLLAFSLHNYSLAEGLYKKALSINTESAVTLNFYATFLSSCLNKIDQAEKYYSKAYLLKSDDEFLNSNYAYFLSQNSRSLDLAGKLFAELIDGESINSNVFGNYAWYLIINKNNIDGAMKYIDKAFALNPYKNDTMAELYFYRYVHYPNYIDEAEKELEKLVDKGVKDIGFNFEAHIILAKENNHPRIQKLEALSKKLFTYSE